ncbi:MAG: photosynthetic protein synthase I [Halieaceae bacterium]|jgi:cytochrome c peroxidase|nr:photosynthetic protein synthase I [Halieaceae bacterium]
MMREKNISARFSLVAGIRQLCAGVAFALPVLLVAPAFAEPAPLAPLPDAEMPSAAKVKLGQLLFFEKRLSGDADRSCADCHIPEQGWAFPEQMSIGYPGTLHYRNAKTVMNVRFAEYFYWDGRLDGGNDLSTQARDSMTDAHFMSADGRIMGQRLKQIPEYVDLFKKAYNGEPYFGLIIKALGDFEKTLVSKNVPFDNFLKGDSGALSQQAKAGLNLFKGKAGCIQCHNGMMLSDGDVHVTGVPVNPDLFVTERYTTLRSQQMFLGTPNYWNLKQDPGFFAVEKDRKYFGAFLTPSLREVATTAPYMHNGMLPTLESVVDFYNKGGETANNKDPRIKPLGLSKNEKAALVAFLKSLSGDDLGIKSANFAEENMPKYKLKQWIGEKN